MYSPGMEKARGLAVTGENEEMKAALASMASLGKSWNLYLVHLDRNDTISPSGKELWFISAFQKKPSKWLADKQIEVRTAAC